MKLLTYQSETGPRIAAVRDGKWVDLRQADPQLPRSIKALLAAGDGALTGARRAMETGDAIDPAGYRCLPPVMHPEKIICVGLNYADHASESGNVLPEEPLIFNKFPTALRGHGDEIVLPPESDQVDYEAELVAVIGRGGRNIPEPTALDHVAGYCCGHDVSARDWQKGKPGGQWLLGKSFDSFAPLGPHLVTADELGDPHSLDIELRLNGETMQRSNTRQLIFKIQTLVAYISRVCTLSPGDLIFSGTPSGVGAARTPPVFLQPGDVVEVEIERVGLLRNPVVAGPQ